MIERERKSVGWLVKYVGPMFFCDVFVTRLKIKQPVCVGIQAVEEKRQGVGGQARLRRSIREASPSRLRVAVAGSGTAPATTYCTLTFPSSV